VLRRKFWPKREEVAGSWIRLHNEELHKMYALPNDQVKEDEMGGTRNTHGRNEYEILVGKPMGKRPRERPGLIWEIILE